MRLVTLVTFVAYCVVTVVISSDEWNYDLSDLAKGPGAWATNFLTCGGLMNSPVNLVTAVSVPAPEWKLTGWDKSSIYSVEDEEFAIKWSLRPGQTLVASGGRLTDVYNLLQFHIHWGADNSKGSEHTMNGQKFPMEIHFVHIRSDFPDAGAAVGSDDSDALAVLGFFFQLQSHDNPNLKTFIDAVIAVRDQLRKDPPSHEVELFNGGNLLSMVEKEMQGDFFRYFGGLTTPSCNEVVQWTVFTKPIGISRSQMDVIRLGNPAAVGGDYFRSPQPLNGRILTRLTAPIRQGDTNIKVCTDIAQLSCTDLGGKGAKPKPVLPVRPVRPRFRNNRRNRNRNRNNRFFRRKGKKCRVFRGRRRC